MSYVLLVTETSDLAADLLVLAAEKRGIPLVRFNQDEFPRYVEVSWRDAKGFSLRSAQFNVTESEISGAWFRKPPRSFADFGEVPELVARESDGFLRGVWETTPWTWMNRPSAVREAEHKLLQLRYAIQLGFAIPDTLVTNAPAAARAFVRRQPAVAKTIVSSGLSIHGDQRVIFTTVITEDDLEADDAIQSCPVIFQTRIRGAFDLRVTVVGDKVFAARIIVQDRRDNEIDWRAIDENRLHYERETLPHAFASSCAKLVSEFGLAYGAIDFVVTEDGRRVFLELNPSGQWGWLERKLQLPISNAILEFLIATHQ